MATMNNKIFSGYQPGQIVEWQKKNNVSKTISVLVLSGLQYTENEDGDGL
jgi:hypothetical protein